MKQLEILTIDLEVVYSFVLMLINPLLLLLIRQSSNNIAELQQIVKCAFSCPTFHVSVTKLLNFCGFTVTDSQPDNN